VDTTGGNDYTPSLHHRAVPCKLLELFEKSANDGVLSRQQVSYSVYTRWPGQHPLRCLHACANTNRR